MAYNSYDLQNTSLVKTGILTEMYIPLWWHSSGSVMDNSTQPNSGLQKGSTTATTTLPPTLHKLSSNWSPNQQFAFEASIYASTSSYAVHCALYDVTTSSLVSSSQINTTSTTFTVLRSGQFTLTPGHSYGVALWITAANNAYLTKASLIAFLS